MERTQPRSILAAVREWGEALIERITRALGPRPEPLMVGASGQRTGANLAAAYSTAAGVRYLAERSASFERMDVLKAALGFAEKGATVREIERRVDTLVGEGVLIGGRSGTEHADRLTTRDLLKTEQTIIRAAREGAGNGVALLDRTMATEAIVALEQQRGFALVTSRRARSWLWYPVIMLFRSFRAMQVPASRPCSALRPRSRHKLVARPCSLRRRPRSSPKCAKAASMRIRLPRCWSRMPTGRGACRQASGEGRFLRTASSSSRRRPWSRPARQHC